MSYSEIDNPGKGNCAFYAFSIGLIDIIKHEQAKYKQSPTFDMLSKEALNMDINITDIINFNYNRQSRNVLDTMQQALRNILFKHRKQNIIDNEDDNKIASTNAHMNFSEMVLNYVENKPTSEGFNELIKSKELIKYVVEGPVLAMKNFNQRHPVISTAKIQEARIRLSMLNTLLKENNISENEKNLIQAEIQYIGNFLDTSSRKEAFKNSIIDEAYRADVFLNDRQGLNPNSLVITAMQDVTCNYRYGTHNDLKELAEIFNINLHTLINGHEEHTPTDLENRPIMTINNKYNRHWTTRLSFIGTGFQGKEYRQFTKNSVITQSEIRDIMQSYTRGFMAIVSTRNHIDKANAIIERCNSNSDINTIIDELKKYINDSTFSHNSSFKKRADYIIARSEYHNEAPVVTGQDRLNHG